MALLEYTLLIVRLPTSTVTRKSHSLSGKRYATVGRWKVFVYINDLTKKLSIKYEQVYNNAHKLKNWIIMYLKIEMKI